MKSQAPKFSKVFMIVALSFMTVPAMADMTGALERIADCAVPADSNNPAEVISLTFKGGDRDSAAQYLVHFATETVERDFAVQAIEWQNNNSVVAVRFANFLVAKIQSGQSSNSTIGVALGRPPRTMTCYANF
ncbi:MAG: hypothetical protein ACXVCY_11365 [Pseudobdellovibrionaceae bacterium]